MHFDPRLWRMTAGLRGRIAASASLGILALALGIIRFAFLGRFLAGVFNGEFYAGALIATASAILVRAWLDYTRGMIAHRTTMRIQETLRGRLFDKIVALGPAWFGSERTGGVMLSLVDGVEQLQSFFGLYLPQVTIAVCAPFAIFGFVAYWDVPVACVMLGAALFTLILPATVHQRTATASRARQSAFKAFGEEFLDGIQGLPTLQAFGQSAAFGDKLAAKARALSDSTFWVLALNVLTRGFTDLGTALGAATALAVGAYRVRHGAMSIEALLIVLMAGTEIFRPLRDLRAVLHQGLHGVSAAQGIMALLDTPVEDASGRTIADLNPDIVFDDVGFAYPGGRRAAHKGLSFRVAAGERIGVVGPSGAGKSTIVRLLCRLHEPRSGSIRIGGQDVREIAPDQLRDMIAVVSQDTYLFHGTIAENLRLGRPEASDADLVAAATAANAHGFITALPQGYDTMIGERGMLLSGGQRQRLAIARTLLRDAPILVLDEALSSVDTDNETIIQQALDRLMIGRTTLILAHRLSSVIGADRIMVLDDGAVVQTGNHADLIMQDGLYRTLMAPQLADRAAAAGTLDATPPPEKRDARAQPLDDEAARIGWRNVGRTLLRVVWPYRKQMAITLVTGVGRVVAFVAVSVIGALIIAAVRDGRPIEGLMIALLATAPLAGLLHWLESWIAHAMAYALLADLRIDLFRKLDQLGIAYLSRRRSGDLVGLATQDVETVEYFFAHTVTPAIVAVLVPTAVLVTLAWIAWPLAFALLPFLAYAGASPFRGRRRIDQLATAARGALGGISAYTIETIQGLAELTMFGATGRRRAGFIAAARAYTDMRLRLLSDVTFHAAALDAATGFGGLAIALTAAMLARNGWFAPTLTPMLVLISVAAFLPVSEIAQVGRQLADTIASTRRLAAVHRETVTLTDGALEPGPGSGIAFQNVTFAYPGRPQPALRDVSFEVRAGTIVALIGRSGSGKSTAAHLLMRFWDVDQGSIHLGGVDLRDLHVAGLRRQIALVAQDTYLFNDTLEANVRLARPDASTGEINDALGRAALADFVADLPEGLATRVGERGVQLSGGQRQRVAIARAFLKDAPVLILDEATSHLDTVNEDAIRHALTALMRDRTTLIIAHQASTIRSANLIVRLRDGQITAGT